MSICLVGWSLVVNGLNHHLYAGLVEELGTKLPAVILQAFGRYSKFWDPIVDGNRCYCVRGIFVAAVALVSHNSLFLIIEIN